ncbi:MAG: hypothetical protein GX660_22335 [Clostridiaceae bacterium]|nr:hypothetical protein [Clostridiaceae bacterium]
MKICNCIKEIEMKSFTKEEAEKYEDSLNKLFKPLGVMPKRLHYEKRIQELTRALNDYANYNIKANKELMLEWTKELTELLERM